MFGQRQSNFNARSANVHDFSMVQRPDVPRSRFVQNFTHKSTFGPNLLIPIYVDEVLPGDTFSLDATLFIRMQTPTVPIMDNIHFDTFFFFVPYRLLWDNWELFITGTGYNGDPNYYTVPQVTYTQSRAPTVCSLGDYLGLPIQPLAAGASFSVTAFPFRAYVKIYNDWFRDEDLIPPVNELTGNGPTESAVYSLFKRGKRYDYFTSSLPWPQKGGASQQLFGFGAQAPLVTLNNQFVGSNTVLRPAAGAGLYLGSDAADRRLYADLSQASQATINTLRLAFATGRLLERDARGGTRYTETLRAHFGVNPPDARLQRAEYLGGGTTHLNMSPIPQTSSTYDPDGSSGSPLGSLGAFANAVGRHGFTRSFVEHGLVMGIIEARADLTYSQGIPRWMWRRTRYDFYWPAFAFLGEQSIQNREIYMSGTASTDDAIFGYQERWAEYRYHLSTINGYFTPGISGSLDYWHLSQAFSATPKLNRQFIEDDMPIGRVLAMGNVSPGLQFLLDSAWTNRCARPVPMYSIPGNLDRF